MQLKKIARTIVLVLAFTAQKINAKPRRVSIDEVQQLIKPEMQKIKNTRLRTMLSQDSAQMLERTFERSTHESKNLKNSP